MVIEEEQLTLELLFLGGFTGDHGHARQVLGEDDLVVIIGIEHAEDSIKQRRVLEKHRRLELPEQ